MIKLPYLDSRKSEQTTRRLICPSCRMITAAQICPVCHIDTADIPEATKNLDPEHHKYAFTPKKCECCGKTGKDIFYCKNIEEKWICEERCKELMEMPKCGYCSHIPKEEWNAQLWKNRNISAEET